MTETDNPSQNDSRNKPGADREAFLPPLEFGSIVFLLYFPALIQLGLMEDPATGQKTESLELAKRNIDLLDLLKDRTKGNLEEEETRFLDGVLDQLKLAYLRKTNNVKM